MAGAEEEVTRAAVSPAGALLVLGGDAGTGAFVASMFNSDPFSDARLLAAQTLRTVSAIVAEEVAARAAMLVLEDERFQRPDAFSAAEEGCGYLVAGPLRGEVRPEVWAPLDDLRALITLNGLDLLPASSNGQLRGALPIDAGPAAPCRGLFGVSLLDTAGAVGSRGLVDAGPAASRRANSDLRGALLACEGFRIVGEREAPQLGRALLSALGSIGQLLLRGGLPADRGPGVPRGGLRRVLFVEEGPGPTRGGKCALRLTLLVSNGVLIIQIGLRLLAAPHGPDANGRLRGALLIDAGPGATRRANSELRGRLHACDGFRIVAGREDPQLGLRRALLVDRGPGMPRSGICRVLVVDEGPGATLGGKSALRVTLLVSDGVLMVEIGLRLLLAAPHRPGANDRLHGALVVNAGTGAPRRGLFGLSGVSLLDTAGAVRSCGLVDAAPVATLGASANANSEPRDALLACAGLPVVAARGAPQLGLALISAPGSIWQLRLDGALLVDMGPRVPRGIRIGRRVLFVGVGPGAIPRAYSDLGVALFVRDGVLIAAVGRLPASPSGRRDQALGGDTAAAPSRSEERIIAAGVASCASKAEVAEEPVIRLLGSDGPAATASRNRALRAVRAFKVMRLPWEDEAQCKDKLARFKNILSDFVWFAVPSVLLFYPRDVGNADNQKHKPSPILALLNNDDASTEKIVVISLFALFISVWIIAYLLATIGRGKNCATMVGILTYTSIISIVGFIDYALSKTMPQTMLCTVLFGLHFAAITCCITGAWAKYMMDLKPQLPNISIRKFQEQFHKMRRNQTQRTMEEPLQREKGDEMC